MAPETKEGKGMTSRQKMIAVVFVIIVIVIGWQVKGLFGGGGASAPAGAITPAQDQPKTMMANTPGGNNSANTTNPSPQPGMNPPAMNPPTMNPPEMTNPMMNQLATQPMAQATPKEASVSIEPQIMDLQKKTEEKYLDQINQLQMLKVQREIAETNQAIAAARLATITAEKNASDILTKPTQIPGITTGLPGVGAPTALPNLLPPATGASTEAGATPPPPPPPPIIEAPYSVVSITMQLGKWSAVLTFNGKLYNVSVGDVLPVDNSVVASINKNAVTLIKNGKTRRISMISTL